MMKKIRRTIYSLCAAAGFLSAVLAPCYSSEGQSFPAADLLHSDEILAEPEISAAKFEDVPQDSWYYPYVDMLVKNGIINGVSETEYMPSGTFNAAECSAVITRYLGLESYAAKRHRDLLLLEREGELPWYAGYVQTLFDTGIIKEEQFGITSEDGFVVINSAEEFSRPLKRYEFAVLITRSFDINTELVGAKNFYPEINDNGNSFIIGGKYDATVEKYAQEINDYWYIPEDAMWDVLKAYYNGIFNGDEAGNFNPNLPILRSEMSKVVAVISDPSMRKRNEYREFSDAFVLTDEKFVTDGWNEKTLDRTHGKKLLEQAAYRISTDVTSDGVKVSYDPCGYPEGYFVEVRFYERSSGTYVEKEKTELSDSETVSVTAKQPGVMMILRNGSDAKVEGVLRINVSSDGTLSTEELFKPVL